MKRMHKNNSALKCWINAEIVLRSFIFRLDIQGEPIIMLGGPSNPLLASIAN